MANEITDSKPIRVAVGRAIAAIVSVSSLVLVGCQVASQSPSPVEFIKGDDRGRRTP